MAIIIPHRFYNRLLPAENIEKINVLIIGTFNPGLPDLSRLNQNEKSEYHAIEEKAKFKKFNSVKNFYDRPQNRFWKLMDYIHHTNFYTQNEISVKNLNGLKFYKGMDREKVFKAQLEFCRANCLFITDIVKEIYPKGFSGIYDNFTDSIIEKSNPVWNTNSIIEVIKKYSPTSVIFNFSLANNSTPEISRQAKMIKNSFPEKVRSLMSTSGAAGNSYKDLIADWMPYII